MKMTSEDKMRLAKGTLDALTHHSSDDICDFCDALTLVPVLKEGTDDTFILTLTKFVDQQLPNSKGMKGRRPLGTMNVTLEVRITDTYVPFDDDDS